MLRFASPCCPLVVPMLSLRCPYVAPLLSLRCPYVVPLLSLCCPIAIPLLPVVPIMLTLYCRRVRCGSRSFAARSPGCRARLVQGEKDALLLDHRVTDRGCRRDMRGKDAGRLGPWVARRNAVRKNIRFIMVCQSSGLLHCSKNVDST